MNRSELSLLRHGVDALSKWMSRAQRSNQSIRKIERIEMDIVKIREKADADIQIIREKSAARVKNKLLTLEELKLKYKIKYKGK